MLKKGRIFLFLALIFSSNAFSRECDSFQTRVYDGYPACSIWQKLSYRDGYEGCKHIHWQNYTESERLRGGLERKYTDLNHKLKTCQDAAQDLDKKIKENDHQMRIIQNVFTVNEKRKKETLKALSLMKESLTVLNSAQESKLQKLMSIFPLIEDEFLKGDEIDLSKYQLNETVSFILKTIFKKNKESDLEETDKLKSIVNDLSSIDLGLVDSNESKIFLTGIKNYFELRKEIAASEIDATKIYELITESIAKVETESSDLIAEFKVLKDEGDVLVAAINKMKKEYDSKVAECASHKVSRDESAKNRDEAATQAKSSKRSHDVMCEDVYTECRWTGSSTCSDFFRQKYHFVD